MVATLRPAPRPIRHIMSREVRHVAARATTHRAREQTSRGGLIISNEFPRYQLVGSVSKMIRRSASPVVARVAADMY